MSKKKPKTPEPQTFKTGWDARTARSSAAIVSVKWMDASVDSGVCLETDQNWTQRYGNFGAVMESVGFLLFEGDDWVVIGMERHAERDSGFRRVLQIPTCAVCEMVFLRERVDG